MIHLKYLIFALFIFHYAIKADYCGGIVEDINDCFNKDATMKNYGCCGLKIKFKYHTQQTCFPAPNTKVGRDYFLKYLISQYNVDETTNVEFVCPHEEVEVKGYCSDFSVVMVDKQSDCFRLSVQNYIDRMPQEEVDKYTCCGVRINKDYDDYTSPIPPRVNLCLPLQKNKEDRDALMKTLVNAWGKDRKKPLPFTFEDLDIVCGN